MPKIVQHNGDSSFVRMRRTFPLTISFNDRKAWARVDQFAEDAKRFDCRTLGTSGRHRRVSTEGYREIADPLQFRETMLRQNGRGSLINSILIDHGRAPRF